MPKSRSESDFIALHAWLIEAGLAGVALESLFDEFCRRLVAAGVPIARGFLSIGGLHPLKRAHSLTWQDGYLTGIADFIHALMDTAIWQESPFRHMMETGTLRLHRRAPLPTPGNSTELEHLVSLAGHLARVLHRADLIDERAAVAYQTP